MSWFYLSLAAAMFLATTDAISKYILSDAEEGLVAWVRWLFAAFFLLPLLFFNEIPDLDPTFWVVSAVAVPLETAAILLYMKAIKVSPLSLTVPFLALTPVFLIATSFILLGELPDSSGVVGILLIATGAYLLHLGSLKRGMLAPLKSIAKEKGSVLMIVVAFIYSITSNLGKIAIIHSSPLFFAIIYSLILSVVLFPIVLLKNGNPLKAIKKRPALFLMAGLLWGLMMLCHFYAIRLIEVPYMISVKRTSIIFSVIYGWLIFKEENIRERLMGGVFMVAGVALIMI